MRQKPGKPAGKRSSGPGGGGKPPSGRPAGPAKGGRGGIKSAKGAAAGPGARAPRPKGPGAGKPKPSWAAEGEPRTFKARPAKGAPGESFAPKPRGRGSEGEPRSFKARPAGPGESKPFRARPASGEDKPFRGKSAAGEARPARPAYRRDIEAEGPARKRPPRLEEDFEPAATAAAAAEAADAVESEIVWGKHAVLEALKGERHVNKVWLLRGTEDARFAGNIRRLAREKGAVLQEVERGKLNELAPATHQGVVASLAPVAYVEVEEIIEKAKASRHPLVLVLDGIEDPHNLGALIRTAGAAGAHGVIIPRRRAVGLTGVVAKSAAGALEHVPVARVNNLAQTLEDLKKAGFWVVGADQDAPGLAYDADLTVPLAIVVGAEGPGVSRLTADKCDLMVRFPMEGAVPSLNASVAGALLLFEAVRQKASAAAGTGPS